MNLITLIIIGIWLIVSPIILGEAGTMLFFSNIIMGGVLVGIVLKKIFDIKKK